MKPQTQACKMENGENSMGNTQHRHPKPRVHPKPGVAVMNRAVCEVQWTNRKTHTKSLHSLL